MHNCSFKADIVYCTRCIVRNNHNIIAQQNVCSNPTPQPLKAPFDDTMTTWEKFSWDDNLKVLDLDFEIVTQENFRQQRDAFYYDYLSTILNRPLLSDSGI